MCFIEDTSIVQFSLHLQHLGLLSLLFEDFIDFDMIWDWRMKVLDFF